jgi:hypothetical protein
MPGKLFIVLFYFFAMIWIQGCGGQGQAGNAGVVSGNSPEQLISGLGTALQKADLPGALTYICKASQSRIGGALQIMDNPMRLRLAVAVLGAKKINESGNRIVYKGTIMLPNGKAVEETFEIITEDGIWKFFNI